MLSEDPSDGELTPDAFSPTQVLVPTSIPILDCVYDGPWLEIHRNLASYVLRAPGVSHSAMYKIGKLSKSWAEWDTFTCLANYHSVLNTLLECLGEKECRSVEASKEVSQDILAILAQMVSIFRDSEAYDAFLTCRGVQAQKLLDFLQDLLDLPLHSNLRPKISKTLVRLCRASKLHPTCFALSGLERVGRQVAGGGFGDIYKGLVGGQHVAVKTMRVFGNVDVEAAEKELGCEAAIWRQLSHPNLLPFYGVYMLKSPIEGVGSEDRRLCLVSPWMDRGDLPHFIRDAPANIDRLSLLVDVAMGLNYLHENGVIHGDLKGPNILVTPSGRACITDFGCSSIAETVSLLFKHSTRTAGGGTARYQAPELLSWENPSPIHPGSDVYAFASLCYEMLTGKLPFFERPNDMAVALAVIEGCRPSRHPTILEALWMLLEECWEKNAEKRPTMPQVIKRLISPSIGASQIQTPTDWDETCSSRFRRSVLPGSFQVTISPPHGLDIFFAGKYCA
ncbi:kinase-like domain-containing protein [Mycena olivaceomarginata]|nr:kinase-like domain-containing protein [Mycena olivaceomarginata]